MQPLKLNVKEFEAQLVKHGLSIDRIGVVSPRTIHSLIKGNSGQITTFKKLAELFDIPIDQLLDGHPAISSVEIPHPTIEIDIKVKIPFLQFDETTHIPIFSQALAEALRTTAFEILNTRRSSTIITVRMSEDDFERLRIEFIYAKNFPSDLGFTIFFGLSAIMTIALEVDLIWNRRFRFFLSILLIVLGIYWLNYFFPDAWPGNPFSDARSSLRPYRLLIRTCKIKSIDLAKPANPQDSPIKNTKAASPENK